MRVAIRVLASFVCGTLLLAAWGFGASEWMIRRSHVVPLRPVQVPRDAAAIAEGGRLATLAGCRGCHGPDGAGLDRGPGDWLHGRMVSPPIARRIADYSDAELARLIHHGLRRDGSTVFFMPTVAHRNLADADVAKIIAWLRTLKPGPKDARAETLWGPVPRLRMLIGAFRPSYDVGEVAEPARSADTGKYFYYAVCSACHALYTPTPRRDQVAPALAPVAARYDPAAFRRLLRTGAGARKADLGIMTKVSKEAMFAFTDAEIAALQAWLRGEAAKQPRQ